MLSKKTKQKKTHLHEAVFENVPVYTEMLETLKPCRVCCISYSVMCFTDQNYPSLHHLTQLFPPLIISRSPKYIPFLLFLARTALILGNVLRLDSESALCCLPPRTRCLVSWTTTRPEQRQRRSLQSFSFQPDAT